MASNSIWRYRWFDTPNNQDAMKKAFALGKEGGKLGLALGAVDVLCSEVKRTNFEKALRLGSWVLPFVGMSTAFTITQQVSLKVFPSLDEKFSFMFGGMSAAGVMGSAWRSGQVAFSGALIFGGVGFAYQYLRESRARAKSMGSRYAEQLTFIPDDYEFISYERAQSSHWMYNNYDWRTMKQPKRGAEVPDMG